MSDKLLTVVMLCCNSRNVVEPALKSIADQTLSPSKYDLIVSIDGNEDGTEELVKKIVPHAIIKQRRENMGIVNHANVAYRNISTPLVMSHTHDDLSLPDRFEYQIDCMMSNPNLVAHVGHAEVFGSRHHQFPKLTARQIKTTYFKASSIISPTAVYRQQLLPEKCVVLNPWLELSEDYGNFARLIALGLEFDVTFKTLIKYHMHDSNAHLKDPVAQNLAARQIMYDLQLKLFRQLRSKDAQLLSTLYTSLLDDDGYKRPTLIKDLAQLGAALNACLFDTELPLGFSSDEYHEMVNIAIGDVAKAVSYFRQFV